MLLNATDAQKKINVVVFFLQVLNINIVKKFMRCEFTTLDNVMSEIKEP
jgi:hypothetical protein